MSAIPDPENPQQYALDGETGDVLFGVWAMPADTAPPTLSELRRDGQHIGWTRGFDLAPEPDDEPVPVLSSLSASFSFTAVDVSRTALDFLFGDLSDFWADHDAIARWESEGGAL